MPRTARKKGNSGIYHIMLRGINRQTIFEDDEDRIKFIALWIITSILLSKKMMSLLKM
jgi:hypothetical protein